MIQRLFLSTIIVNIFGALPLAARALDIESLATRALQSDAAAVAELRAGGPEALAALVARRDHLKTLESGKAEIERFNTLIDQVGRAKYCSVSGLYWHTDLAAAQQAASASGKPILSLRMMGNLTDELSCANSRFFRTSLYANAEISEYLRNHFILHWKSVRPVPKVTIDFGDGRKLERTLTGNSIHYILAADGQPIDALPGLYGPAPFLAQLKAGEAVVQEYQKQTADQRTELLTRFHEQQIGEISMRWEADLAKLGVPVAAPNARANLEALRAKLAPTPQALAAPPRAEAAARVARPKQLVEMPIIRAVVVASLVSLEKKTDEALWDKIAALHSDEARLDAASVALIRKQNPDARRAGAVAVTKRRVEDPILKLVANFQSSIALDTVRNEYLLHRRIHEWLADGKLGQDVEALNDRVYAELFLTPKSDPWIGLVPPDTYTAIENGGVVSETK